MVGSTVMAGCARKVRMFGTGVQCADVGVTGPINAKARTEGKRGIFVIFKSLKRPKLFLGVCEPKYLFTM